jgi:hypothetical protein
VGQIGLQGANGWYVAWEDRAGFHHQSAVTYGSEQAARRVARERQMQYESDERVESRLEEDYSRGGYR